MPREPLARDPWLIGRRHWLMAALVGVCGCTTPLFFRGQSPELEEPPEPERPVRLVRDLAMPWGMNYVKVESVALVTGLDGTGSDPPPSSQRNLLIGEMQSHQVKHPNQVLAAPSTSMVLVRGFLPPGVQKGDRFDVEVRLPSRSETTDLQGGWLMLTRLREMQVLDNSIHSGHIIGLAEGHVLIDAVFEGKDQPVLKTRGRVLGGGMAQRSRPLGLVARGENSSIRTTTMVSSAINARFHTFDRGVKTGVAKPKDDNYIELLIHPRYKNNVGRYMRVVRSIAVAEAPADLVQRRATLQRRLLEPTTAANAALQLEAIGRQAVAPLEKGLRSADPEVRFYAAEALAYMDEGSAAEVLAEAARNEPAFRWHALTALAAMNHVSAYDALTDLLNVPSAETRYGAFHALRARNPRDPMVKGEILGEKFAYHVISTAGEPMIHFTRSRRPEIVLFGHEQRLHSPAFLFAGKEILIKGVDENRVRVSRFAVGQEDEHHICSNELDTVIRTVIKLGGGYAEVLQAVHASTESKELDSRMIVDAMPRRGRVYRRDTDAEGPAADEKSLAQPASPTPELFIDQLAESPSESRRQDNRDFDVDPSEHAPKKKGFWARTMGWWR